MDEPFTVKSDNLEHKGHALPIEAVMRRGRYRYCVGEPDCAKIRCKRHHDNQAVCLSHDQSGALSTLLMPSRIREVHEPDFPPLDTSLLQ